MREIEVKILEVDRSEVERTLRKLGATISFDGEMSALFFDFADRRITNAGSVLRLRRENQHTVLTHKWAVTQQLAKVMEETETQVQDFDAMREILLSTGLEIIEATRKFRMQYDLPDGQVVIDDYQDDLAAIPVFIEIESPSLDQLRHIIHQLGYRPEDANSWSTYDLVRYYIS
jgi:adenylate cyclase, class 2